VSRAAKDVGAAERGSSPVLEVSDLEVGFPTDRGLARAVDRVSFTLDRGETLGIVGESGSGKSMLARAVMGMTPASATTAGEVRLNGLDLRTLSPRTLRKYWGAQVSMVFQDPMTSLNPVVRVGRNLTEMLRTHGIADRREAKQRAKELLAEVRIPDPEARLRSYPHELSGGMRQRVGIAIAIACRPRLLIADEPTTALDVTVQRQILDVLAQIQSDTGMTSIIISHDLGVVSGRTDRVAVMYGGRFVETARTIRLFQATRHPYTAALLASIPRLENQPHSPIPVIPGLPRPVIDPIGCNFATRCARAQPKCLVEEPPLQGPDPEHLYACWFPVGTPRGDAALGRNVAAGTTATGLVIDEPAGDIVQVGIAARTTA
jgi:peptide/nickel transport system ATP-binding protein